MAKANLGDVLGGWAFLIGVLLALVVGLFTITTAALMTTLVVIGIIVGLLNVGVKETTHFLFSGVVLVLVSSAGMNLMASIPYINGILAALMAIFVPATVVVAVKNVFGLAKR